MPSSKSSIDHRDVYYRLGKSAGYRARSAYKLLHLDEEFDLFTGVQTAVDLCAAPGSWSQVLGQKLTDEGRKIVSVDLQPMARLPNITILQTDITLPSTVPLVLDALGGRKADLVVCDGAPDVTGVHDLDAYLHSQLLLAAITLSLTLLAPHSTLIFKIFLSPLDPQAALLSSQLRCFFPGPSSSEEEYEEFDLSEKDVIDQDLKDGKMEVDEIVSPNAGRDGYDLKGRRGGVWVRKPRSSRKGSGEAFIVCRNFDPIRVPLPNIFSDSALAELRQQKTGTLTLDSLASLGTSEVKSSNEWEMIKAYVGGGDLNPITAFPTPSKAKPIAPPIKLQPSTSPSDHHEQLSTSPKALFAHPTPLDGPPEYFSPKASPEPTSPTRRVKAAPSFLSPEPLHLDARRLAGPAARAAALAYGSSDLAEGSSRQSSLDSLTPNPSPIHLSDPSRPWASSSHVQPSSHHSAAAQLSVPAPQNRDRSSSNASVLSATSARDDYLSATTPLISPSLSSSSKTDLFFSSSTKDSLPIPPRALPNAAKLGRGLPSGVSKNEDRSVSMPSRRPSQTQREERTSAWAESSSGVGSIDLTSPFPSSQGYIPSNYSGLPVRDDLKFGFEEISTTSRLRSVSNPNSISIPGTPTSTNHSPATSRFLKSNQMNEPLATLPTLPDVNQYTTPTKNRMGHGRRESQQLEREHSQAKDGVGCKMGDVVEPEPGDDEDNEGEDKKKSRKGWKLISKLGEGAFSAVWSAIPLSDTDNAKDNSNSEGRIAALKLMDRQLSLTDSRTRISFLREVEVLRHISHPSIVSYLDSFTTPTHHVLVLEQLKGGELFDLMSNEENRKRMLLPSPTPTPSSGDANGWDQDGEGFIRRIFSELTRAVGWLHEVGVVHRDIKLENILFTINPFTLPSTSTNSIPLQLLPTNAPLIKLTDFGLSRFISTSSPLLQTRCGSESFAAPEIIMGKPYDGRETDSWAMGVVLYGLVVGELPFDRDDDPSGSVIGQGEVKLRGGRRKRMIKIAKCEYTYPRDLRCTNQVKELIDKLLVRDPKKRLKVNSKEIWELDWMNHTKPGGLPRPPSSSLSTSNEGMTRDGKIVKRKVLDGFLVEEDGIEGVARAEH
ncbi:CAMK protein kinase [Kwoniella mangroviensis CBS 8886]|uniref:uncharacterized protein n=1 Tax=Kwoniella mangroviensis CBS 8507 TaxID=1296122 RepID=UPI00080D0313|nr:CAMK protein kinase [Kwoniella mangroviensis CBS 8507]OCF66208.1 CAMK protein kinase [Kwoniella mangroviensis CBS 8507]OCF71153.1 CAMK protein kinase [Kwoniella mangroviensis CBS 8886]